jgi:DivIVA domain-containing protein
VYTQVIAWVFIGVGLLAAAHSAIKLTVGRSRPGMAERSARRKAWLDLWQAATSVALGLSLLGTKDPRTAWLQWPALAFLLAFSILGSSFWRRSRMGDESDAKAGEDAAAGAGVGEQPRGKTPFPAASASAADVAEWVDTKTFSTTRLRPGYRQEEVDDFLDTIRDAFLGVSASALTSNDVKRIRFATTRLKPGYDEEDVDEFLDYVEARLAT